MKKIEYIEGNEQALDSIRKLWEKLNEHHRIRSQHFSKHYSRRTFTMRKKELLEKSKSGAIHIDIAKDLDTGEFMGYCVSTISKDFRGEIDSIYVEADYRESGIGDKLMKIALQRMDDKQVKTRILQVGAGNEEVFAFYSSYNFYPRTIILEQIKTKKAKASSKKEA
jgi:ribosomal protein S18 acetylase RimI-like enzyme